MMEAGGGGGPSGGGGPGDFQGALPPDPRIRVGNTDREHACVIVSQKRITHTTGL